MDGVSVGRQQFLFFIKIKYKICIHHNSTTHHNIAPDKKACYLPNHVVKPEVSTHSHCLSSRLNFKGKFTIEIRLKASSKVWWLCVRGSDKKRVNFIRVKRNYKSDFIIVVHTPQLTATLGR